jgi:hypothetical protein
MDPRVKPEDDEGSKASPQITNAEDRAETPAQAYLPPSGGESDFNSLAEPDEVRLREAKC